MTLEIKTIGFCGLCGKYQSIMLQQRDQEVREHNFVCKDCLEEIQQRIDNEGKKWL
jgi:hypothetical protein